MPTAKKTATISQLSEKLGRMNAAALIDYRGFTVEEITDLRTHLRKSNVELQVAKNTLLRAAAHQSNLVNLDDMFAGPNAVAFINGDEAAGSKALEVYFKTARIGSVKFGVMKGGRRLTAKDFSTIADLPSRDALLSQLAGLFNSPLSNLASLLQAPMQQFAYALTAFEQQGGAGNAPAAAPAPVETTPVVEASIAEPTDTESAVTPVEEAGEPEATMPEATIDAETVPTEETPSDPPTDTQE